MFDVGFWELVVVGVVALLVFGPERLPRVAREAALWIKKARSMASSVKAEIDHELQLQDLRQSLEDQKRQFERESQAILERVKPELEQHQATKPAESPEPSVEHDHGRT